MIRKVSYFSMKVPNRPGIGAQMLKSIAMSKHNLLAFTGFPQGGKAQVDFVPANPVEFAKGAKKHGVNLGQRKTAFLVQGEDRDKVLGDFDPEVMVDDGVIHGDIHVPGYVISIVRRAPGR